MTSKKCQTSSSALGIGDKFKVQSPHLGESSPQNSEVTTNVIKQENVQSQPIFANKLSNNEESEDESKENNIDDINSSQSPVQGPNLQSLLFPPATVLAAGLNPYILSSSLSTMTQLLKKTDHSPASLPGLQSSPGPASLLSGLNRPAMTDALLENLRKLNGSHLLGQEADNLRKILESVNLEMTRRILEDNLLRWGGPLPGQGWAERLSGSRHNSCDSDGNMSDTDTESFYLDTERSEAMDTSGERKSRVRSLISDEQLSVLKSYYSRNQMPRREELMQIAEAIGHPYKVVKVWFQNSRAKDRREGKLSGPSGGLVKYPTPPPSTASSQQVISPAASPGPGVKREGRELPLDLTITARAQLSPSVTPPPLIVAEPETDKQSPGVNTGEKLARENFEQMIREKLITLVPDLEIAKTQPKIKSEEAEEERGVYNCDQCDKTFTKKSSITRHKYEHSGMLTIGIRIICDLTFEHFQTYVHTNAQNVTRLSNISTT